MPSNTFPEQIDQYTLTGILGSGGMGCVYDAFDANGQHVALKMMSNNLSYNPLYRTLFENEVNALKDMSHPNIVKILGNPFSDKAGNFYLPMEFVDGKTVAQYICDRGMPFSCDEAVSIMCKILDAIGYVHKHGHIHRDIKPSNIMISPDGNDVCLIDFGIAKDAKVGSTGHTVGTIIGTDGYMSPEQANGLNIDKRTDIYSLGCVLFYMLTGQDAIQKQQNNQATIIAINNTAMPMPSSVNQSVPIWIDEVFAVAVDKDMTKRYQKASEFKSALLQHGPTPDVVVVTPTVAVGRGKNNDIIINDPHLHVSSNHLTITGTQEVVNGQVNHFIHIIDHSTNGTGISGKLFKNATETINYTSMANLPEVLLAGYPEFTLDWVQVIARLKQQGWGNQPQPQPILDLVDPVKKPWWKSWGCMSVFLVSFILITLFL